MRRKQNIRRQQHAYIRWGLICLTVGFAAYNLINLAAAATYSKTAQAEAGVIAGRAKPVNDSAASGGQSVLFGSTNAACQTPTNDRMLDQNPNDDPNRPWQRSTPELIIYFETGKLPSEFAAYAQTGVANWSTSECVDAKAVATCPSNVICIPMTMTNDDEGGVVGRYSHDYNDDYMLSGSIKFFTKNLANDDASERQMTVSHEIGHALSQNHRLGSTAIMYTPSSGKNSLIPDATDLHNLRVVYGTGPPQAAPEEAGIPEQLDNSGPVRQGSDDLTH